MAFVASVAQWVEGARPRTLPNAIAPVIAGTGAAAWLDSAVWWKALLALVVSVAMIVGVNYANDYSDGIRGTDEVRVGPLRLVGSGVAAPAAVRRAAVAALGVAALAGLVLVVVSGAWVLLLVGAAAVAAAWLYTGGARPYGYLGLGEVVVFVFFGLVAVVGTTYVQAGRVVPTAVVGGVAVGALACAILVANNLRDVPTDTVVGKRTLAVRLGEARTRALFTGLVVVPYVLAVALALTGRPWCLLTLVSLPLAVRAAAPVLRRARGRDLVPVLRDTGLTELAYAVLLGTALSVSG